MSEDVNSGMVTNQQTAAEFAARPMGELGETTCRNKKKYVLVIAGAALAAKDTVVLNTSTWTATLSTTQGASKVAGICAAAVASGSYFWLQIAGLATGRKGSTGSTDIADGDFVINSATAGGGALDGNQQSAAIQARKVGIAQSAQAVTGGDVTVLLTNPLNLDNPKRR